MEKVRIPWKSWVVVCDGARALVLRNDGDGELLNLIPVDITFEHQPPTRDLGADRPGRVYQSQGSSRSATEDTDWHSQAEEQFLKKVAEELDVHVRDRGITHLVLVAPPKALGILRESLAPATLAVIFAEIPKDLVKLPIPELEKHLSV